MVKNYAQLDFCGPVRNAAIQTFEKPAPMDKSFFILEFSSLINLKNQQKSLIQ